MQSEMSRHRPRDWLVCLALALSAASTDATLRESAANLTLTSADIQRDCSDLQPNSTSGVYLLTPGLDGQYVPTYCDMDSDGGGWTVILRRGDIEPRVGFYRDWESYKWGLGALDGEFYWGNERLWLLTSQLDRQYQAHIWLQDFDGNTRHALYQNFEVESEAAHYRLRLGEYSGDAGDSFSYNSNHAFSTFDRDYDANSGHCTDSTSHAAAWWFNDCGSCQLTGSYYDGGHSGDSRRGITWHGWKSMEPYSLKAAVMKIKPA